MRAILMDLNASSSEAPADQPSVLAYNTDGQKTPSGCGTTWTGSAQKSRAAVLTVMRPGLLEQAM